MHTPDELAQMYFDAQQGVPLIDIARSVGINYQSVQSALHTLDKYLNGKARAQRRHSPNYREAVKLICK